MPYDGDAPHRASSRWRGATSSFEPTMKRHLLALLSVLSLSTTLPAYSHEFWMSAALAKPPHQRVAQLSLHVGENFEGQLIGWTAASILALQHVSASGKIDLRPRLNEYPVGGFNLTLEKNGTHLVALDSAPNLITLEAEKFNAYLREEGLEEIIAQREAAGKSNTAGRESYRRHVKALIVAGGKADATFSQRTGQRLEIVPLRNPFSSGTNANLPLVVLFEGKPLANALVKAWLKQEQQLLLIKARSDDKGEVKLRLPYAGRWMVSVVHMLATNANTDTDRADKAADWESLWGNLTFELPATATHKK